MKNELLAIDPDFSGEIVISGTEVSFPQYESILERVIKIRDYLERIEVTEESLGNAKKLIAGIRKEIDKLNRQRIDSKKIYLRPFEEVEVQIKEISDIAMQADISIRSQTRRLEELERERKEDQIREIFDKRIKRYKFPVEVKFEDFIRPSHLNKSVSLNKVEKEMATWLEERKIDIEYLTNQNEDVKLLNYYFGAGELSLSKTLKYQTWIEEEAKRFYEERSIKNNNPYSKWEHIPCQYLQIPEKDFEIAKAILEKHNIQYKEVQI